MDVYWVFVDFICWGIFDFLVECDGMILFEICGCFVMVGIGFLCQVIFQYFVVFEECGFVCFVRVGCIKVYYFCIEFLCEIMCWWFIDGEED